MPASCRYDVQPSVEQIQLMLYSNRACLSHPFEPCCIPLLKPQGCRASREPFNVSPTLEGAHAELQGLGVN